MLDWQERKLREEEHDAKTNPLYACGVKYVKAFDARLAGVAVDPALPDDAQIGLVTAEGAYDPKYGLDEGSASQDSPGEPAGGDSPPQTT